MINTPLGCERHISSGGNEVDIEKMLLQYNYDAINYNIKTPLHIASRDNSAEVELPNGACTLSGDNFVNTPIHYAALNWNSKIMFILLHENGPTIKDNSNQEYPLFFSSSQAHTVVGWLLQFGVEGLKPDLTGRNPLHRSAARGHFEIVKFLRQD